jgi:hypothetical protein
MPLPENGQASAHITARLRATAARLALREGLHAAAAAAAVVALLLGAGALAWRTPAAWLSVMALVAAAAMWLWSRRTRWSTAAAAAACEGASPQSRNVVVTAAELQLHPERSSPFVRSRVYDDARLVLDGMDVRRAVPLRNSAIVCLLSLLLAGTAAAIGPFRAAGPRDTPSAEPAGSGVVADATRIQATILPPAYVEAQPQTLTNPEKIEAIEGSRLVLDVTPRSPSWRVRFGQNPLALKHQEGGSRVEAALTESGYFAIEDPPSGISRLLPVLVVPDRAPVVRVEDPAKDLLLPAATGTIRVAASATDDHGLTALELRYTKVSGSGEQFEFEEGTLPLRREPRSIRDWTATGGLPIARLGLKPGDALVYRVVARDARPGDAGLSSSDTFFVEIAGPGQVAVEGFELPPDRERYALSQQMIVLKIQRLRARERGLAKVALADETAAIAAEQRAVRSNFIFLLGGHVEDEFEEAEGSHEIVEGRLENTARREIDAAIQHMSRAEQALVAIATGEALAEARLAVRALQRAFGRNRYILRTLPVRSRLDPSRRLTGALDEAAGWSRDAAEESPRATTAAARDTLATLLELLPAVRQRDPVAQGRLTRLAEQALTVAPADENWQRIAAALIDLRDRLRTAPAADLDRSFSDALALANAEVLRGAVAAESGAADDGALRGAWTAERVRR